MALKDFFNVSGFGEDFRSRNFSIYGQWTGIVSIFICLIFGIVNIFHFSWVILFSVFAIVQGLILIFVELPFLLKICPLSDNFINFIKGFNKNWPRTIFYGLMSLIQFLSLTAAVTSLLVPAITLAIAFIFYGIAAVFNQDFANSNVVGGLNTDQLPSEAVVRQIL
ncbi:hypothetical protein PACTADRAFT_50670 [Pachysolen tannophilus NRRL Y-2460]|uniref:Golgi apparatus membrane protein TVP18 n=1 Tax=Pachysolen tannophilus NRRL Y-2460 TaxID=669874 RepID=A0A1E4TST8_PACTA|nr:hypothetical protein PACTADRAFT_50670 [Pachysolen tannophilus NRRL Y-2460]